MERMTLYFVLCIFCWIHFYKCLGSEVKLTATPSTITNGLTDSLNLRCTLQDTTDASSVVVGRQVSSTTFDIEHVNSIIISRVNHDATVTSLAEIIISENANVLDDLQTLTAVGTLTPSEPDDSEYLELTWSHPGEKQSGSYVCEVNGLDPHGHGVMLQTSMAVNSADPEVRDLVNELNNLTATLDVLISKIKDLDEANNNLKATVDGLTPQVQDLAKENNDLKAIVATHKAPHTETGMVSCGDSDDWPHLSGTGAKGRSVPVTFKQPYSSPPAVIIADRSGDLYVDNDGNIGHAWWAGNVDTTGFIMNCKTWGGGRFEEQEMQWTSIVA